ncbi:Chromatin structure-remodeling complex protein rsc9 [Thoreauomyces humboldtii]|nr:Chromatin structure-remodeling complex protein rsc9 [Thoreauomyces humboldtii]
MKFNSVFVLALAGTVAAQFPGVAMSGISMPEAAFGAYAQQIQTDYNALPNPNAMVTKAVQDLVSVAGHGPVDVNAVTYLAERLAAVLPQGVASPLASDAMQLQSAGADSKNGQPIPVPTPFLAIVTLGGTISATAIGGINPATTIPAATIQTQTAAQTVWSTTIISGTPTSVPPITISTMSEMGSTAASPEIGSGSPGKRRQQRSRAESEDIVMRGPDYDAFIKDLEAFNLPLGVTLQKEPIMGGKRLDLHVIYTRVLEAGGYEAVTSARGWKRITDPFNLPTTCTNSAFIVKQLYQKYLYNYEQFHVHGKSKQSLLEEPRAFDQTSNGAADESTPNSPELKPEMLAATDQSARTNAATTTSKPALAAPNPPQMPATPAIVANPTYVRVAPPPVPSTAPMSIPAYVSIPNPAPRMHILNPPPAIISQIPTGVPRPYNPSSSSTPSNVRPFVPHDSVHKRLRQMAEANINAQQRAAPQPAPPKPQYAPRSNLVAVNPDDDGRDEKYLHGAWQNRLMLAIASKLPNEVDWAFSKLIKLSFSKNFYLGILPNILDEILDHASALFENIEIIRENGFIEARLKPRGKLADASGLNSSDTHDTMERVLQVLHILRNLSFWPDNAVFLVRNHLFLTYVAKGAALSADSPYLEIKHYCVDLLDNLSPYMALQGKDDFFLAILRQMVMGDDRALIISSAQTLTRFCTSEINGKTFLEADNTDLVLRFLQLLLVPDEPLVTAVLDFFYEFSSLSNEASTLLADAAGYNVLKLLTKFLGWQSLSRKRPLPEDGPPTMTPFLSSSAGSTQRRMSTILPPEFMNTPVPGTPGNSNSITNGIPPREVPLPTAASGVLPAGMSLESAPMEGVEIAVAPHPDAENAMELSQTYADSVPQEPSTVICCWRVGGTPGAAQLCYATFHIRADLVAHLESTHLMDRTQLDGCQWQDCARGRGNGWPFGRLLKHIVTHLDVSSAGSASTSSQHSAPAPARTGPTFADTLQVTAQTDELRGIPLTAMLVLRNLARVPGNHALFAPVEPALVMKMCNEAKFSKGLAGVLGELART